MNQSAPNNTSKLPSARILIGKENYAFEMMGKSVDPVSFLPPTTTIADIGTCTRGTSQDLMQL